MKRIIALLLCLALCLCCFAGCGEGDKNDGTDYSKGTHYAKIKVKNYGTIKLELYADVAPITVENFCTLANDGFYDGLTFHRIINGFMIQGGDPDHNGSGGSANEIKGEFAANGIENNISHKRGVISMARANPYDSASSQFFIVHKDSDFLDGNYAAFGMVTEGMDIVDRLATETPVVDSNGTVLYENQPVIERITITPGKGSTKVPNEILSISNIKDSSDLKGTYHAEIEVKDYGTIKLELYADIAPITVENFCDLATAGFYDGLTFHRIIDGFMIQGGDPDHNGTGGNTDEDGNEINIKGEFSANGVENNLSHTRGVISMARANPNDSGSSQFFIVHEDSPHLDGNYAAFGKVTEGMEIVDKIAADAIVEDDNGSVLYENQPVITKITITDYK